jgi:peptidoglycan/xylan/chitin deacetylase (PgdA/CDA1 family)
MSLRVLMYHDIEAEPTRRRYSFTAAQLAEHLRALRASAGGPPAAPRDADGDPEGFALSFDDGHPGWLAASDALAALGWSAYFFVITGRIGAAGALSAAELRRLDAAGHVVGSHSVDHPYRLAAREPAFIEAQWSDSRKALEDALGKPVLTASVPGGSYTRKVGLAAEAAGVRRLFTSEPLATPWSDGSCRVHGRYALVNGMGPEQALALAQGRWRATASQLALWNVKKAARAVMDGPYQALRRALYTGTT